MLHSQSHYDKVLGCLSDIVRQELRGDLHLVHPQKLPAFMTKRMNLPQSDADIAVTDWENIAATDRPLPDLEGWHCTAGLDYASMRDWASVDLHFKRGEERFDISRSWLCLRSPDLGRIKAPWRDWARCRSPPSGRSGPAWCCWPPSEGRAYPPR